MKIACEYCDCIFEISEDDLYEYVICPYCDNVFEATPDDIEEEQNRDFDKIKIKSKKSNLKK